ncbi:MAG: hypothetical protein ACKVOQ_12280 [Cyclobacteriaceae bacterium]
MKKIKFLVLALSASSLLMSCSKSSDPAVNSNVSLTMSAATSNGKTTIGGRIATEGSRTDSAGVAVTLTDVIVNIREIEFDFDHEDEHFKKDSAFNEDKEAKLKGPFIVDLLNAGAFVDQVITSVNIPNAKYEKVSFKLSPSTEAGNMNGKTILITGNIGKTPFVFWTNAKAKFGAKFSDSTMVSNGTAVNVSIKLELDKVLTVANGIDFSKLQDGNKDGTITIDPLNTDGNKNLAEKIFKLLARHTHCEKGKK